MNRLKQKLKSETGASILIGLLFFLICTLVAASLLMAAMSNAGKIKSNQEIHRKYLAVSSALELVCKDISGAKYYGQYSLTITETTVEKPAKPGNQGKPNGTDAQQQTFDHNYVQQAGQYDCQLSAMLLRELDSIFAEQMKADVSLFPSVGNVTNHVDVAEFENPGTDNTTHTLVVEPSGTDGTKLGKVQITVTLDRTSYTIDLSASLLDDASFSMEAELTPTAYPPRLVEQTADGIYTTAPMTWKLGWITKTPDK